MWRIARRRSLLFAPGLGHRSGDLKGSDLEFFSPLTRPLGNLPSFSQSLGSRELCSEMGSGRSLQRLGDSVAGLYISCVDNGAAFSGNLSNSCKFNIGSARGFSGAAEAVVSTDEDVSSVEEIKNPLEEFPQEVSEGKKTRPNMGGLGHGKYLLLKRRQINMETEAWENAATEYKELMMDMCKKKLAPNLPYMKSLFLGWFEPLGDQIQAEQESCRKGKNRTAYAKYFDHLPAEMMAVITMHKLMGLMMTSSDNGSARVVQAACQIGEAIENESRIHRFLAQTKKKTSSPDETADEKSEIVNKDRGLKKKVRSLIKQSKLRLVRRIVKGKDSSEPWGVEGHAKVMIKRQRTAFPPNFVHSLDGSHTMMTAVACKRAGLNFAGVHDSYWTHACDVDHMNRILREKFVELYEKPILEKLLDDFQKLFPKLKFPPLPDRGDFDLKEVLGSTYFFN